MNKNKILEDKKILIIVPHQDDEINIAGGIIASINNKNNIKVVYTTNGDYIYNATVRYKEAYNSLKILGIERENIIFLGYSDQPYDEKTHMYNYENEKWVSKKGISKTYGALNTEEWSYHKHKVHNLYRKDNIVKDLEEIINEFLPEVIICVDLDFHPDHIMTSLSFEKALGKILNSKKNKYNPIVLKTFAYENAYLGLEDFNEINDKEMKFDIQNDRSKTNPYYKIEEEISFPININCYSKNLIINPIWKAINKHKSQLLVKNAFKIINSNYTYWRRKTNNLLYNSVLSTSSGDSELLRDFMICDTSNVLNGNQQKILYDKGIWKPTKEDKKKEINITFYKEEFVEKIVFYHGLENKNVKDIRILLDNKIYYNEYFFDEKSKVQDIPIQKSVTKIKIILLGDTVQNGFSEIEIVGKDEFDYKYIKGIIDNSWTDNYICNDKTVKDYELNVYSYRNKYNEIQLDISNLRNATYINNKLQLSQASKGYLYIFNKNDNSLNDKIYINKNRIIKILLIKLNKITLKLKIISTKIYRKLFI